MHPVRIGCSGWSYKDWRGDLYPDGLPQRRWLERYAEIFGTVEVNATFYRLPKVAGFIGSPAMNFMPAEVSGGRVKLPIGEVDAGDAAGQAEGKVIAGLRPENFEDASIVGDDLKRERGIVFEIEADLVESLGSDLYVYFHMESERVESDQLADLVGDSLDETGGAPLREGQEQVIARLDASSGIRRGERANLWVDTARLRLFDPDSGASLTQTLHA